MRSLLNQWRRKLLSLLVVAATLFVSAPPASAQQDGDCNDPKTSQFIIDNAGKWGPMGQELLAALQSGEAAFCWAKGIRQNMGAFGFLMKQGNVWVIYLDLDLAGNNLALLHL